MVSCAPRRRYFNSHAHVERDHDTMCYNIDTVISTHTLTWSVTEPPASTSMFRRISTHTLTWSVTVHVCHPFQRQRHFNSHAHVERDVFAAVGQFDVVYFNSHAHVERDERLGFCCQRNLISTHTLTWSVTSRCYPCR